MIGYISGTVKAARKNYLLVATDFVGYRVFVIPQILLSSQPNSKISLYTHTHVREDQLSLYGFSTMPELDFFELLLTVSGVGPKVAMSIMSIADLEVIKSGILNGDAAVFTKVSGVGRKTADRLIMELKDKIGETAMAAEEFKEISQTHADAMDVLLALGYSRSEARGALQGVPKDVTDSEEKIRLALRALAKQ
ncbi:MAG: Holliday junction branch migration protein RuvA [bacterium]|nr:Holliday junction branch migration protein RuvA [bacterium]